MAWTISVDQFSGFEDYDRLTERLARRVPARPVAKREHLGHRHVPQHLPRRTPAARCRLLIWKFSGLGEDQPRAPLQWGALYQRPRDADLGQEERGGRARSPSNYRAPEGAQRGQTDAQRLVLVHLRGGAERLRDATGRKLHSTQKPRRRRRSAFSLPTSRPDDLVPTLSPAPVRPGPLPNAWAGADHGGARAGLLPADPADRIARSSPSPVPAPDETPSMPA